MTAKRGGTRQAPAAAASTVVVAGAPASPAEEDLISAPAVVPEATVLDEITDTVDLLTEVADAVDEGAAEAAAEAPVVNRLAALAALTGAPATVAAPAVVVAPVAPNGDVQTWADGDQPLISGVVVFDMLRATVAGRLEQARKGTTVYAPVDVIDRAVALGAVVRAD